MRSTYDDFSISVDYEENRNRSRSAFYHSSSNNSNANNNNNNNNSAIPYHARENSLPFSYGQIQNRTSTPLKNGGHGGNIDLVGRTETNYDFDLKSIAGGGSGERYGRSPDRRINGGVDGVGGGMLKPQARLTSPILVRKTLNSRSPTRAGAANTNTIANTYHYNNNNNSSNGLNGNSRGRTPPRDDFEDLLRERRDRVYNDYYRSTLPSLPPEPPQRQRHALSSGPTTARLASTVVNGGRRSPGVNFYTSSNLNTKSGSILKSNSNLGSIGPPPPSKYNFDFEFHLNLDDLPPPPASFANNNNNNNNNSNSSYTIERTPQYRTRDIPVVDLVERNYHTISSTNAFRETQQQQQQQQQRQHQQQQQQQQFEPQQSMSQTLKRSAYATYGNENAPGYGNTNYTNSNSNNYNNNNNSYGSYNGERGAASQQQRSQFERLMAARTTTAAAAGGTVAGVDVGRNYSNISYTNNNNHNNNSGNNNGYMNGLPPSSASAAPIYATTTKQGGGRSASTQTTTTTTMYRSGGEPEMSVTDYASLSLPLPTTAVGAAAPMVSPASPPPPSLVSRPETPAFPVTPRTPFGYNGGQSSPATGGPQTHYSTETLYQTITPTGRGSVLAGTGGFRSRLNSSAMSVEGAPAPQEVAAHLVKFAKDSSRYWYKATLSRDEAIALLLNAAPGTFVVRDSTTYKNAYGLVVRVAQPPPGSATGKRDELVRHFLIEPTTRGVRLKGCANEPVFTSLSALVYEHSINQLALPCLLRIPEQDLLPPLQEPTPAQRQLLTQGAACNVLWLFSCETESLTGEEAIRKAIRQMYASRPTLPAPTEVHFKVTQQGITLTDNTRKRFFRKHYVADDISFCAIDPDHRLWTMGEEAADGGGGDVVGALKKTIFAFVAKRSASSKDNQCHVFCDLAVSQPASAIVSFVNKTLPTEKQRNYIL